MKNAHSDEGQRNTTAAVSASHSSSDRQRYGPAAVPDSDDFRRIWKEFGDIDKWCAHHRRKLQSVCSENAQLREDCNRLLNENDALKIRVNNIESKLAALSVLIELGEVENVYTSHSPTLLPATAATDVAAQMEATELYDSEASDLSQSDFAALLEPTLCEEVTSFVRSKTS